MEVNCIHGVGYDSNIYVILGKIPTIIDCGTGLNQSYVDEKILEIIDPSKIKQIIITHEHYDHCGGVRNLYNLTNKNAKVLAHINAVEKIEKGESEFAKMLGGRMPKMPVDFGLKDGDEIRIGDELFLIIHTPGHTPGSMCLYSKESKSLFSGDTVFAYGSFGRYDFPGGNARELRESIRRLAKLDVLNLYPGHDQFIEGDGNSHMRAVLDNTSYLDDI